MGAFAAILGLLMPAINNIIGRAIPDSDKQREVEVEIQKLIVTAQMEADKAQAIENEAKRDIIVKELDNGWAGNWRAYLMMVCIFIVGYNWVIVSFLNAFLAPLGLPIHAVNVPTELWTLVTVGLGGYIGKETVQNYSEAKVEKARIENPPNDKAFFDSAKVLFPQGMSQEQVNVFNAALRARDGVK